MKFGMWQHDMLKYHMPKLWQCAVKGSLWAHILLNMTLNTVGAIEKCLLSFDKTPHISNGIIFQLQVF